MVNKDAKIDKTFLIAEPMGKVSWTKCFAWGGLRQVGVDLRGTYARMPQQDLDQTDVRALLEHVCGKAVAKLWRSECGRNLSSKPHSFRALLKPARKPARNRFGDWNTGHSCTVGATGM
jgi:hypothetical protein